MKHVLKTKDLYPMKLTYYTKHKNKNKRTHRHACSWLKERNKITRHAMGFLPNKYV